MSAARRLPSAPISFQIMALLLAGLVLAQIATLVLTLLLPPTPPPRRSLGDIARSLQGVPDPADGQRPLLRKTQPAPPSLQSPGWQVSERGSQELARILGVETARVRLLFYAPPPFAGLGGPPPPRDGGQPPELRPQELQPMGWAEPQRPVGLIRASLDMSKSFQIAQGGPPPGGMSMPGGMGGGMPGGFPGGGVSPGGGRFPGGDPGVRRPGGFPGGERTLPSGQIPGGQAGQRPNGRPTYDDDTGSRIRRPIPTQGQAPTQRERPQAGQGPQPGDAPTRRGAASPSIEAAPTGPRSETIQGPPVPGQGGTPVLDTRAIPLPPRGEILRAPIFIPPPPSQLSLPTPLPIPSPATTARSAPPPAAARPVIETRGPSSIETAAAPVVAAQEQPSRPATSLAVPNPAPPAASETRLAETAPPAAGLPLPEPQSRGLFGLAPAPFVSGDFIAALQTGPNAWTTVQPEPEGLLTGWQKRILLWFLVSFALVAPVGYLFARRLARPLDQFARAAERLGRDPSAPAPADMGPAEVGRAARAFNDMQARIRRYIEDRNGMIGAISHDLRTPLSRMRFRLERTPPDVRAAMSRDIDQMEAMITSVLTFMREDAANAHRERVDLRSILEVVTDDAALGGGAVELEPGAPAEVEVDLLGVQRVFANLIDNALKYGQQAQIRLFMDEGEAVTEITDKGPGLGEEELERVFQPFYRGQSSLSNRGGVGLGLAVSRSTVRAHGGDIRLRRAPQGLVAEVRIPVIKTAA